MTLSGSHFNFPKLHVIEHYGYFIRLFGTTDGYNSEASERLHIDNVKEAFHATNFKNFMPQMITWLSRREKLHAFKPWVNWREGRNVRKSRKRKYNSTRTDPISMAINPSKRRVPIHTLIDNHGARAFTSALQTFIAEYTRRNGPHSAM